MHMLVDMMCIRLLCWVQLVWPNELKRKNGREASSLSFQPAAEKLPGGASLMIEDGVLENPDVDKIIGQHVSPGNFSRAL